MATPGVHQQNYMHVCSSIHLAQIATALKLQNLTVHITPSAGSWNTATLIEVLLGVVFLDSGLDTAATANAVSLFGISQQPPPVQPRKVASDVTEQSQPRGRRARIRHDAATLGRKEA